MTVLAPAPHPRILVVDDDLGPRESLRMLLRPSYEIRTADSGRRALAEAPRYHPDLVILDIKMPDMNGLEVLRRLKEHDASVAVVMITAYASLDTVKQALTHGAFEYLIKPFSRRDLEAVVGRALSWRQQELGARGAVSRLVEDMRTLSAKTRELEETARREATEQSLRLTQLSILREIARGFVAQLEPSALVAAVTEQLRAALGYDEVTISTAGGVGGTASALVTAFDIRDAEGGLGTLWVDTRRSGRVLDPRERELLEMLAEYLAIALRNSRLYGQIAETKRSLEQLIAAAGNAIVSIDAATDRIAGWNPAAEQIFGLSGAEALARDIADIVGADSYAAAKSRLESAGALCAFETVAVSGPRAGARLAVTLSRSAGRFIAIVRDVTRQREQEGRLRQSEKLAALGQLAGGIAHDFNNLLQAILGYTQLMKQTPDDLPFVQRSLDRVEAAALDGSETVRRIQQFARLRPEEQFVPVDLNSLVREAVALTRPRWDETHARGQRPVHVELDLGDVRPIDGRPAALTEVMINLILNAVDAMTTGGTLTIATRRGRAATAVISVRDTGIGIPDALRPRIFEPFFSTKGESGSGLGLAMAYSIVKRHGGEIEVDSSPGGGTTFTLVFAEVTRDVHATPPAELSAPQACARILLVDDEARVRDALAELLLTAGHTVTPVGGGPAALAEFKPGRFDIVICDLGLAGMNGWQVVEGVRAADPDVTILLVTGWGLHEEDVTRMTELRVSRCLFKPVAAHELHQAVQDVTRA